MSEFGGAEVVPHGLGDAAAELRRLLALVVRLSLVTSDQAELWPVLFRLRTAACHFPGRSSNVLASSSASWNSRR